jgi:hypothetical protein
MKHEHHDLITTLAYFARSLVKRDQKGYAGKTDDRENLPTTI